MAGPVQNFCAPECCHCRAPSQQELRQKPRDSKPGAEIRRAAHLLAIVPALLAAANLAELHSVPSGLWRQRLIGTNAMVCLKSIPFLGLAPLAAALFCLRQGAPDHPALAGAAAGLLAGAIGAALLPPIARMIRRFSSRPGTRWRLRLSPPLAPWRGRGFCAGEGRYCFDPRSKAWGWLTARRGS
jgi:Negative regulator of sigma F